MTALRVTRTVLVDTREQRPWFLRGHAARRGRDGLAEVGPLVVDGIELASVRRATLTAGDYALEGAEDFLVVERKNLADLAGCVTGGRERFERMLGRLAETCRHPFLIVEAGPAEIELEQWRGRTGRRAVVGSLFAWCLDHGIKPWLAGDAHAAERHVARLFWIAEKRLSSAMGGRRSGRRSPAAPTGGKNSE